MYSSAYGRPMGAPQGGVQYPGMQPPQPTYASPYGGPSQSMNSMSGSSLAQKPMSGGLPSSPTGSQPLALAQPNYARPLAPQPQPLSPATALAAPQAPQSAPQAPQPALVSAREQMLEAKVRQLEQTVADKDAEIRELQATVANLQKANPPKSSARGPPARSGSGFRRSMEGTPVNKYSAIDQEDPIDIRLEEFYNTTDSAIQFKRINKGFYRFGDSIVELDIMNHKLMAKTEDGWNRGKFGPIEKFLGYYENIERERIGVVG